VRKKRKSGKGRECMEVSNSRVKDATLKKGKRDKQHSVKQTSFQNILLVILLLLEARSKDF
jgi:hypothetical protein